MRLLKLIIPIVTSKYTLIIFSLILFVLGNIAYSTLIDIPWYIRSIISEFMFILMYTIVDYGNLKYKYKFAIPHVIILLVLFFPLFLPLFYSKAAQLFSVSIAILAILINAKVLHILHNKGLANILCSRISTTIASSIEILLFSFILNLGLKGAILMIILRPIYIALIPKFIFKKNLLLHS